MPMEDYYRNTCKIHNTGYNDYCIACHNESVETLLRRKKGISVQGTDTWKPVPPKDGYRHGEAVSKPMSNEEWAKTEEAKRTQPSANWKDTNPKDAVGTKKVPFSTIPATVIAELGIALLEGARKYGRHNYRIASVRYSVYYDATLRHLTAWWEGQDIDPDSGLSHITKAIAGLTVLRDAMIHGKVVDDRPPVSPENWLKNLQSNVDDIFERHPTSVPAYTQVHD